MELEKRKQTKNGNLSARDFNEVFNEIVAKELKTRGYYDDKYWSEVRVSQGVTFVTQTEEERRYQEKVNAMENKMKRMGGLMKHWLSFMLKKFPEEDFIKEMVADLHDEVSIYSTCRTCCYLLYGSVGDLTVSDYFVRLHAVQNLFAPPLVVLHMYMSTLLLGSMRKKVKKSHT